MGDFELFADLLEGGNGTSSSFDDDDAANIDAITALIDSSEAAEAPATAPCSNTNKLALQIPVLSLPSTSSIYQPPVICGLTRKQRVDRWKRKRLSRDWSKKRRDPAFLVRQEIAAKRQRNNGRFSAAKTVWVNASAHS